MADTINNTHENDVIFNMDSLREFIKLIKRQGTENIDFYAVSELLQLPSENYMVTTLTGEKDNNLEPWIELYNNQQRQIAEQNLFNAFTNDTINKKLVRNLSLRIYQYIPAIYKQSFVKDPEGNIGIIPGSYFIDEPSKFGEVTPANPIVEEYIQTREYNFETKQWKDNKVPTGYTSAILNKTISLEVPYVIKSKKETKENNQETTYSLNYYESLDAILRTIANNNSIDINNETLWLTTPIPDMDSRDYKLFFVIKDVDKTGIINYLGSYSNYNKKINALKDIDPIKVYEKGPIQNPDKPWWKYIYTKYNGSMTYTTGNNQINYYLEFNEEELKANPGKIVVVRKIHPWQQDKTTDNNSSNDINIKSGRHLYVQAGSLLKFNPGQSTEDKDLIDDYWTNMTPGTFSIDENDGQKAHIITIRGFDQNGNFNNKNYFIVGYISQNDTPSDTDKNGAYKIGSDDYNLTPEQLAALQQQPDIPVYLDGTVIGYIKSKDIPKESDENGAYEINDQKYNLDPNLIIPLAQANIIPVYLNNNNNASITTHELIVDKINLAGDEAGDKTKFLRSDSQWADTLEGPLTLGNRDIDNTNIRLGIWGTGNVDANGNDSATVSIHTKGGIKADLNIWGSKVFKAVFNDYAEFRQTINLTPGHIVIDNDDGSLSCTTKRLQPGAQVISDTFGDAMGWTEKCQTPIAVAGRVLVYTYQSRENYHAGMAVCSAPNGTIDIMTREEIKEYPDCIIGIVSEIPNYEKWGTDQVDVNGRIWIKLK